MPPYSLDDQEFTVSDKELGSVHVSITDPGYKTVKRKNQWLLEYEGGDVVNQSEKVDTRL